MVESRRYGLKSLPLELSLGSSSIIVIADTDEDESVQEWNTIIYPPIRF
jgi:hypothetical protein